MEHSNSALVTQLTRTKAFIFDMDGTLVNLESLNVSIFSDVLSRNVHLILTNADYQTYISGSGSLLGLRRLLEAYGKGITHAEALQKEYRTLKLKLLSTQFHTYVTPTPGAIELISSLRKRGALLALTTSTIQEYTQIILKNLNLDRLFHCVITAENITSPKPHPEAYLTTLSKLGVTSQESLVFEDSVNGIASARAAHIFCVGILNQGLNDEFISEADAIIDDFTEVLTLIDPKNKDPVV